jgi:uncharacterized protein (TIGR03083 family)
MAFTREQTIDGILSDWSATAELLRSLSDDEWRAPSRCEGWEVRDVAGHMVGLVVDAIAGKAGQRTPDEQAAERRERSPQEVAEELDRAIASARQVFAGFDDATWAGPSGVPDLTMAEGVEALWFDGYIHDDDMRAAVGRPPLESAGLRMSVEHLATLLNQRGWGPATIAVDGVPEQSIGQGGPKVSGDPRQFVLAATGRADPEPLGLDPSVNVYA